MSGDRHATHASRDSGWLPGRLGNQLVAGGRTLHAGCRVRRHGGRRGRPVIVSPLTEQDREFPAKDDGLAIDPPDMSDDAIEHAIGPRKLAHLIAKTIIRDAQLADLST